MLYMPSSIQLRGQRRVDGVGVRNLISTQVAEGAVPRRVGGVEADGRDARGARGRERVELCLGMVRRRRFAALLLLLSDKYRLEVRAAEVARVAEFDVRGRVAEAASACVHAIAATYLHRQSNRSPHAGFWNWRRSSLS